MSKVHAFTKGMLRSLDTFGAGRRDHILAAESKSLSSRTPQDRMRADWERVGKYIENSMKLLGGRG